MVSTIASMAVPFLPSHVALVVRSLAAARACLAPLGPTFAAIEEHPSDGMREQYVGLERAAPLLLCEPLDGTGPYARALHDHGPGLHHIGVSVPDLPAYLAGLAGSGWFVLPGSVADIPRGVAWLARPGVHTLIEVCVLTDRPAPPLVSLVEVAMTPPRPGLIERLGLPGRPLAGVTVSPDAQSWLTIAGMRMAASGLAQGCAP